MVGREAGVERRRLSSDMTSSLGEIRFGVKMVYYSSETLAAKSTKSTRCWRSSAPPSPAPC